MRVDFIEKPAKVTTNISVTTNGILYRLSNTNGSSWSLTSILTL